MSRCDSYDGGDDLVPEGLWNHRLWQATRTKKGVARLKEFGAILDAMPVKRLITDALLDANGEVCFVGAIAQAKKLPHLPKGECDIQDTALAGKDAGIPWTLAWEMACMNDETWGAMTPEERWQAARDWINSEIAASSSPASEAE